MENNSAADLDLNEEPVGSSTYDLRPFLDGIGVAQDTEYRIRYLAYLTARARYRQRRQALQTSAERSTLPTETALVHANDDGDVELIPREPQTRLEPNERDVERGKSCKRDNSQLVAKALEMDTEVHINSQDGGGGNFYDCNICLYIAREPILTCCGHLFCWACFYKLPYADSFMKECPVCNGEVTDSTIVPIYGHGDGPRESKLDSSTVIPQRPRAQRVESARQQRVARGGFHIPVTEVLRRIRTSIGAINDDREQEVGGSVDVHFGNSEQQQQQRRLRTQQLSARLISESGDSLSYISAALSSAERLVADIETYINLRQLQRRNAQILSPIDEDSIARDAAIATALQAQERASQPEAEAVADAEVEAEINPPHAPATTAPSSSRTNGVLENPRSSSASALNLPPPSSRRRSSSRLSIRQSDPSHQTRRRRLR